MQIGNLTVCDGYVWLIEQSRLVINKEHFYERVYDKCS